MSDTKDSKNPVGRPSKYKPEYCDTVIEVMRDGSSLVSFCALIGIHKDTVSEWVKVHPEFSAAYKKAKVLCQHYWETMLRATATGEIKGNLGAQVFWMKNRFRDDWKDSFPTETETEDEPQPVTLETVEIVKLMEERKKIEPGK